MAEINNSSLSQHLHRQAQDSVLTEYNHTDSKYAFVTKRVSMRKPVRRSVQLKYLYSLPEVVYMTPGPAVTVGVNLSTE